MFASESGFTRSFSSWEIREVGYSGVIFNGPDDVVPEVGVVAGELVCEGREDILEDFPIEEIPRTEKASTEESVMGDYFRD